MRVYLVTMIGLGDISHYVLSKDEWLKLPSDKDLQPFIGEVTNLGVFSRTKFLFEWLNENNAKIIAEAQDVAY